MSPCSFNFYAECIMRNARLDEAQAGMKIAGRNINNLRDAEDTTLMEENEEELKSLLMSLFTLLLGKCRERGPSLGVKICEF